MTPNESPEQYDSISANLSYMWWCLKCQTWHGSPYCPHDNTDASFMKSAEFFTIEICPHCGQIIRQEWREK